MARKKVEKIQSLFSSNKKSIESVKMDKLQIICPTNYSFVMVEALWRAHYQILPMISLKEFIILNANAGMIIKKLKNLELNPMT